MKKFAKLSYEVEIVELNTPWLTIKTDPELYIESEMGLIMFNREYFEEIISALEAVLSGEKKAYMFGYESNSFDCDKEECDVYFWDDKIGLLRTQDVYDMLKYFQQYRDDYYAGHR